MTPTHRRILVVDDDSAMGEMVVALLEDHGIDAETVSSADAALGRVADSDFDVVLSDIRMPGRSGVELLGELREVEPDLPVVLMTAFGSIDSAIEAMRAGAFHYVTKPFKREEVLVVLERAIEHRALQAENQRLRRAVDKTASFGDLLGQSAAMREIFALLRKVADSRSSVLITGESGTGKEVVSRTLHFCGARRDAPFVPINCTAIPEGLLESELFGHKKGAFTGADRDKQGLFEKANGGTLFLDEIGDMGAGLQSKLLRVLQDGEVRPVGGSDSVKVDVRIVAATNKDLQKEIDEGRFRRDLYYRLNVIPIEIPPLRERREDVDVLAQAFAARHTSEGQPPRQLSDDALARLRACEWRGNARELENVIERSLALCDDVVVGADALVLSDDEAAARSNGAGGAAGAAVSWVDQLVELELPLREVEDRYTAAVLAAAGGSKTRAAKILGVNRRTLYRWGDRVAAVEGEAASA